MKSLSEYFCQMDEELRKIYHTDPLFYQAVHHAAHLGLEYPSMLELAFKAVSKERDHFKNMVLDYARLNAIPTVVV